MWRNGTTAAVVVVVGLAECVPASDIPCCGDGGAGGVVCNWLFSNRVLIKLLR